MKLSVQTQNLVDTYGIEEAYKLISDAGFTAVDFNIDHSWKFSEVKKATKLENLCIFEKSIPDILDYYKEELENIRKYNLTITQCHAPFPAYDIGREDILDYTINLYKNCILFCEEIGCKRIIIHGISVRHDWVDSFEFEDAQRLNLKLYTSLIPTLLQTNVMVCLENLFVSNNQLGPSFKEGTCGTSTDAIYLIDLLNEKAGKKCFGLCLDTGHMNLLRSNISKYIQEVNSRIVCFHLHDNNQLADQHMAPYTGNFRWDEFLKAVKKIGYNGDLSFETFNQVVPIRTPKELVPTFLKMIKEIGDYFKSQLI